MNKSKPENIASIFSNFEKISSDFSYQKLNSGHINQSFWVQNNQRKFILQKINASVFKNLEIITENIRCVSSHLKSRNYPHFILESLPFSDGSFLWDETWRLLNYAEKTMTFEKVKSPEQAYEAAKFLGEFHGYLRDLDTNKLKDSIPEFLDFNSRFQNFKSSLKSASEGRLKISENEIEFLLSHEDILENWNEISSKLPERIIHADPKISNFLFEVNSSEKIKALIDWDTLMKGTILYDFGDMVRSYTNFREEDDPGFGENFSLGNYKALKKGFLYHLENQLYPIEKENMDLAGKLVVYIQAIRFLTDYLNGDIYYQIHHPEQNLNRAKNQIHLLKEMLEKLD